MTTSHHNKVVIKADSIKSIDYINHSLVITSGQPSSPPPPDIPKIVEVLEKNGVTLAE